MSNADELKKLCYDEKGAVKPKPECRAAIINHLILDETLDIDEAEDLADKTLQEVNLWEQAETTPSPSLARHASQGDAGGPGLSL